MNEHIALSQEKLQRFDQNRIASNIRLKSILQSKEVDLDEVNSDKGPASEAGALGNSIVHYRSTNQMGSGTKSVPAIRKRNTATNPSFQSNGQLNSATKGKLESITSGILKSHRVAPD